MRIGEMVRADGGPPMKLVGVDAGEAECIWIDSEGSIRRRFCDASRLTPMWMTLGPKSLWPEGGNLDAVEIAREERAAASEKSRERKAAKKARRSNKTKRKAVA